MKLENGNFVENFYIPYYIYLNKLIINLANMLTKLLVSFLHMLSWFCHFKLIMRTSLQIDNIIFYFLNFKRIFVSSFSLTVFVAAYYSVFNSSFLMSWNVLLETLFEREREGESLLSKARDTAF